VLPAQDHPLEHQPRVLHPLDHQPAAVDHPLQGRQDLAEPLR
jgi:hypothetical protein